MTQDKQCDIVWQADERRSSGLQTFPPLCIILKFLALSICVCVCVCYVRERERKEGEPFLLKYFNEERLSDVRSIDDLGIQDRADRLVARKSVSDLYSDIQF